MSWRALVRAWALAFAPLLYVKLVLVFLAPERVDSRKKWFEQEASRSPRGALPASALLVRGKVGAQQPLSARATICMAFFVSVL
ncbi:hypothetical protein HDK64DRAFT_266226 [Phyllosticta capitalensis]